MRVEIEQGADMPNSVRKVLKNSSLTGIYNTIGNVLDCEEQYTKALNTAINSCRNFIITKDEESAKRAINYLKDERLGRATFFPLSVIKERTVDHESLNILKNSVDFLGIMSDLITYNEDYDSVVKNQLGNVVVATDMDSATRLSHMIKAKYKIVTLEGDVVNVGGSLTGGSANITKSVVILNQELKHLENTSELLKKEEAEIELELQDNSREISELEEKLFDVSKERVTIREKLDAKQSEKRELEEQLASISKEHESLESIKNNSISEKEQELIKLYHEKTAMKEEHEIRLK